MSAVLVTRLGLTLLHFLWQGTLLALALGLGLWLLQGRSPRLRYALACGAMLLMLGAPLFTWARLGGPVPRSVVRSAPASPAPPLAPGAAAPSTHLDFAAALPIGVALWALGVALLSLRLAARDGGISIEVDPKVDGIYSFKFIDTPWDQIMDVVIKTAGLAWEIRDGALHVAPPQKAPQP